MKTFLVISVLLGCALHMVYAKPSCCSSEDMAIVQEILLAGLQDNTVTHEDVKAFMQTLGEMDEVAQAQYFSLVLKFGAKIVPLIAKYGYKIVSLISTYGSAFTFISKYGQTAINAISEYGQKGIDALKQYGANAYRVLTGGENMQDAVSQEENVHKIILAALQDNTVTHEDVKAFMETVSEMDEVARAQVLSLVLKYGAKILPLIAKYGHKIVNIIATYGTALDLILTYGKTAVDTIVQFGQKGINMHLNNMEPMHIVFSLVGKICKSPFYRKHLLMNILLLI